MPHFSGGLLAGRVVVHGRDTRTHRPRDLADLVGVVGQDPLAGFVTDTVEEELAYAMEQLALPAAVMRKRVEETLDVLGIAELRDAPLRELSGGQQQRVAIGSVLTTQPRVLVLDEPTSALDPAGAEEVLAAITRLVHDLAVTVLVAEHRVERVLQYADRVVHVGTDGTVTDGPPAAMMRDSDIAPPVVELGRWAGWDPLPLSVRDARRAGAGLRAVLADLSPPRPALARPGGDSSSALVGAGAWGRGAARRRRGGRGRRPRPAAGRGDRAHGTQRRRQVLAAVGAAGQRDAHVRHGAGGSRRRRRPRSLDARRTARGGRSRPAERVGPALPRHRRGRVRAGGPRGRAAEGTCAALLERIAPGVDPGLHPRDLVEGQRLALVLAVQLTADPPVLLLDEPTRGLDYSAKRALREAVRDLAQQGRSVVLSTHDVEFVADAADRVVVLADGEVVADGPTSEVVVSSPAFAPQVAKVPHRATGSRSTRSARAPGRCAVTAPATAPGTAPASDEPPSAVRAIALRPRSTVAVALVSVAGVLAFGWPLLVDPGTALAHGTDAPLVFGLLLPLLMAVVLFEIGEGGLDAKALAMLGVLSAVGAALRPLGAGTAGLETVFFLLVLGGRVFGAGFGFVLGATTLFASALLTGGVGSVAAVPDARCRLGGPRCRAASPRVRARRDRAARGVRRGGRAGVRVR